MAAIEPYNANPFQGYQRNDQPDQPLLPHASTSSAISGRQVEQLARLQSSGNFHTFSYRTTGEQFVYIDNINDEIAFDSEQAMQKYFAQKSNGLWICESRGNLSYWYNSGYFCYSPTEVDTFEELQNQLKKWNRRVKFFVSFFAIATLGMFVGGFIHSVQKQRNFQQLPADSSDITPEHINTMHARAAPIPTGIIPSQTGVELSPYFLGINESALFSASPPIQNMTVTGEGGLPLPNGLTYSSGISPLAETTSSPLIKKGKIIGPLIFTASESGLRVYRVDNPPDLPEVGFLPTTGKATQVASYDNTNFLVSDDSGRVSCIDGKYPNALKVINTLIVGGVPLDIVVNGDYAYVAASGNLVVINLSGPFPAIERTILAPDTLSDLSLSEDASTLFGAATSSGLVIWDLTDPSFPSWSSTTSTGSAVLQVKNQGAWAYLTDAFSNLIPINVFNTSAPQVGNSIALAGVGREIVIRDSRMLIADQSNGIIELDCQDPSTPSIVSTQPIPGGAQGIALRDGRRYIFGSELSIFSDSERSLSGFPAVGTSGAYALEACATNSDDETSCIPFSLTIPPATSLTTSFTGQTAINGEFYSLFVDRYTPVGSFPTSVTIENRPPWTTLTDGLLQGIPTNIATIYPMVVHSYFLNQPIASTSVPLAVGSKPVLNFPLPVNEGIAGFPLTYVINSPFTTNAPPLTYSATLVGGDNLPDWLSFSSTGDDLTFSGTVPGDYLGSFAVNVKATDSLGISAEATFFNNLVADLAPIVSAKIPNMEASVGIPFLEVIPNGVFIDKNPVTLSASLAGGLLLPDWLTFEPETGTFSGTPSAGDTGAISPAIHTIEVTGSDGKASASTTFTLSVEGTSTFEAMFKMIGIPSAVLTTCICMLECRYKPINKWRKERYYAPPQTFKPNEQLPVGQEKIPIHKFEKLKDKKYYLRCLRDERPTDLPHWLHFSRYDRTLYRVGTVDESSGTNIVIKMRSHACCSNGKNIEAINLRITSQKDPITSQEGTYMTFSESPIELHESGSKSG